MSNDTSTTTIKMDDAPDFIEVKGVKGKRYNSARYYSDGWKLRIEYLFDLTELHEVGGAKHYDCSQPTMTKEEK